MTEAQAEPASTFEGKNPISMFALATLIFRWRKTIIALSLFGAVLGLVKGLTSPRMYMSTATFIPQGSEGGASPLALAASQFGIAMPSSGGGWGPPIYLELLSSPVLLEPIALDTLTVAEEGGRRVAFTDLFKIKAASRAERSDQAVIALRGLVKATEDKRLGAVKVAVTTRWPSVSLALANRLVHGVNSFNLQTRKSQAAAERQFVEGQAGDAERALRDAEDRLQSFLQRNRTYSNAPELLFEHDRLLRDVGLRQQVYNTLLGSLEEARIREVRDTPVITVLEEPRLPVVGQPRGSKQNAILGLFLGVLIGVVAAVLTEWISAVRRSPSPEARQFFELLRRATPRALRRDPA